MCHDRIPLAFNQSSACFAASGATTATIPTPRFRVRSRSDWGTCPASAITEKTGGAEQVVRSIVALVPCGGKRARFTTSWPRGPTEQHHYDNLEYSTTLAD